MSIKKKMLCLVVAMSVTIPVYAFNEGLNTYAEKIEIIKKDEETKSLISKAKYDIYEIGKEGKSDKKLLSVTTNDDGKLDSKSVKMHVDGTNPVGDDGKIDLQPGSYYMVETDAPESYMLNVKSEIINVVSGKDDSIQVFNKKFPSNMGQAVVKVIDKRNSAGLIGSTLQLSKKEKDSYKVIGDFSTDAEGYLIGSADGVDLYNSTLILPAGSYRIVQKSVTGNYALNDSNMDFTVSEGKTSFITISNEYKDNSISDNNPVDSSKIDKTTGVKIKVINSNNNKPIEKQGVAIFSVDGNKETEVFNGVTNANGFLDSKDATVGKDLAIDSVIHLSPGKYYYKLTQYKNSVKHNFEVEKGKIGNQTLKLNVNKADRKALIHSNTTTPKLAKTGFEEMTIYTVAGLTFLLAGFILLKNKKID